jgi:hypothetical protein
MQEGLPQRKTEIEDVTAQEKIDLAETKTAKAYVEEPKEGISQELRERGQGVGG